MNRTALRKIHAIAGILGFLCITAFWSTTLISELFLSHYAVAVVKQSICYALIVFIPLMVLTGLSGNKMGGKSQHPMIAAKRRRMPVIALNGVLIMAPCALYLNHLAQTEQFAAPSFYAVQLLELLAGAGNLTLIGLNARDGLRIRKR